MLLQIIEQWESLVPIAKVWITCCICFNVVIWAALCYMFDELDEPEKKKDKVDLDAMLRNLRSRGHKVDD